MPNIKFDFSNTNIFHNTKESKDNSQTYTYRDIATSKIYMKKDNKTEKLTVKDTNGSNFDMDAVRSALNNILNFKNGEAILEPEFGIGKVYELLYTPFDKYTTQKMLKTIQSIVSLWEPRISIISTPTTYDEDKQEFCVTINYYVPALQETDTLKYYMKK